MDRWMLERTADLVKKCREWYAAFEFHRVFHAIHDFCVVDLSAFYFDVLKDRLYTKAPNNPVAPLGANRRLQNHQRADPPCRADSGFHREEIWKYLAEISRQPSTVHIASLPRRSELRRGLDRCPNP